MTKTDFINEVVKAFPTGKITKKQAGVLVSAVFGAISTAVKKEKRFAYPSFGTFSVRKYKKRTGRNPKTGDPIEIPARKSVHFKPAPKLKGVL